MTGQLGVIYMLHFDRPYRHARHYVGKAASSGLLKVSGGSVAVSWREPKG